MIKALKYMLYLILGLITLLVVSYLAVDVWLPNFGGKFTKEIHSNYQGSHQFSDGKFRNVKPVPKDLSFGQTVSLAYKFFTTKVDNPRPKDSLPVVRLDSADVADYKGDSRLFWYGHSSFLLQMQGNNILLDPMFGDVAAPLSFLGEKRFDAQFPLEVEKLEKIDLVIFSHDHYDHLDYPTILKIKEKTEHFYVPLGVGIHLETWGVPKERITEFDWWEEKNFKNLKIACTPSQHFSGRRFSNGQSTLWSSWVIQSTEENLYFSGDSGYNDHFKQIGDKYGPFDLALLECGQYNKLWSDIHMMPEETAMAGKDLQSNYIIPIHWAGFKLALHPWKDPIERVLKAAKNLNVKVVTPKIGEGVIIKVKNGNYSHWWEEIK
jgi:L-ascorbate metabolism protein UlaG (beta-lactamase superfamily)